MSVPQLGSSEESFDWLAGARVTVVLAAAACAGRLSVVEIRADAGYAAATHTHRNEDEVFYVVAGALTGVER